MSLFGFARDIGRRLFNRDEDAAEKIKEMIEANNPGVKNLDISYEDGLVGMEGECDSVEALQKCVLMAGNVEGVKDVDASRMKLPPKPEAPEVEVSVDEAVEENVEYYEIKSGDTLSKIAKRVYGDAMQYTKIFEANREVIEDPDKIYVGQKIRIPKA
jgi:nucleoid-associated protein YgaU